MVNVSTNQVVAGEMIGSVKTDPPWCSDKAYVHVAMRREGTENYIDPTDYVRKRKMIKPKWEKGCDRYILIFKVGCVNGVALVFIMSYSANYIRYNTLTGQACFNETQCLNIIWPLTVYEY